MLPRIQRILQQAVVAHRAGRLNEAAAFYAKVLAVTPGSFDALHLAGLLAHQQGRHAEAAAMLTRALKLKPGNSICAMRLGAVHLALGRLDDAAKTLRAAVRLQPDLAEAWGALSLVLLRQGSLAEARAAIERALSFQPQNAEWLDRRGALGVEMEGFAAAEPWFRRAVAHAPELLNGWINLGVALVMTHRPEEALPCFDRALTISPGHAHALTGRGVALERSYRVREAVEVYGEALAQDPAHHQARSARLLSLHYLDDVAPDQMAREHREFGAQFTVEDTFEYGGVRESGKRLRLAIVSPDLRTHSVACFLEPLLRNLPRDQFEVHLYHDHQVVDETSATLRSLAAGWHHTAGLPHDVFMQRVRSDVPDIALDLAGHTDRNRLPAFAQRLAPVQVSYLGYPNTTGVASMDYRLTDAVCDPVGGTDQWHTEKLVRFAPTAWAYAPPVDAPDVVLRSGEDDGSVVTFGCFNNFSKISDSTLRIWASLLEAVPGACLLLKAHGLSDAAVHERQLARLSTCGIDPARTELLERVPDRQAHLALYSRVDVALDTFPYHGTTTTCEALWMGVPVVTCVGEHHAARVGASLLTAIGHPEWIAENREDYRSIATDLATDRPLLTKLRAQLRSDVQASPLLQHGLQAERFATALRDCWREWCERKAAVASAG